MIHSRWIEQTVRIVGCCSIDPVTLTGLALAGIGAAGGAAVGGALAAGTPGASNATPATPPTPEQAAPTVQQPIGTPAGRSGGGGSGGTSSFVGSAAVPAQTGYGQKTLLGQ